LRESTGVVGRDFQIFKGRVEARNSGKLSLAKNSRFSTIWRAVVFPFCLLSTLKKLEGKLAVHCSVGLRLQRMTVSQRSGGPSLAADNLLSALGGPGDVRSPVSGHEQAEFTSAGT
ncbi:hypothetical protein, partial [uncultured Mailhella sp.]|uniref:hypothetical protein n=1 Tax=uncultured Mailhella sp. TaxID=1981031 RepID=UPI0025FC2A24